MKRTMTLTAVTALLAVMVCSGSAWATVEVRVTGGYTYISHGDYNDFADYANGLLEIDGVTEDDFENIKWIPEFGAEVLISTMPWMKVGIGAGILFGSADLSLSEGGDWYKWEHKVKAYPFTATGYFEPFVPEVPLKPYFFGGLGLYYSKLTLSENLGDSVDSYGYEAELTKWGFGLHGGAGLEFSLAPTVKLDIGLKGRWAELKGFEGTATDSNGEKVDVYLAGGKTSDGDSYFGVDSVDSDEDWEEGSVNLSGVGFTLTLKIGF